MIDNPVPGDGRSDAEPQLPLIDLLSAFIGLSNDTDHAGRIMLLTSTGQFVGDVSLSDRDVQIAIKALAAAQALTEATADLEVPGSTPADIKVAPELEADLEEHCFGLDADFLMEMAAQDPSKAVAAFDEITGQDDA